MRSVAATCCGLSGDCRRSHTSSRSRRARIVFKASADAAGAAGVSLACVFVVSSAFAVEPDTRVRTEDILFQDLNLTTTAGVDALYRRIHSAAERVCTDSGQSNLAESASAKCTKDAEARAIKEINLPALTLVAANR